MLFAAGLGTRLKPFTDKHPKALAKVNDKSLLQRNIEYLKRHGVDEVVINVHHFADQIIAELDQHAGYGSIIHISDEKEEVLETGGGLKRAAHFFQQETIVIMNVDILTDLNLSKMLDWHLQGGQQVSLAVTKRSSSRQLLFNTSMELCAWRNNNTGEEKLARSEQDLQSFSFSGIHIMHSSFIDKIMYSGKFSIIDAYLGLAAETPIVGYDHSGDILVDVGKPESIQVAESLFF